MLGQAISAPCAPACPILEGRGTAGSGWPQSAPNTAAASYRLHIEGQAAYQKRRYDDARRAFQAALVADPQFHAPKLGLVEILMRKDQVNEAASELGALLMQAFVPWHRVALQDPDLAPLWAHAEKTTLPTALAQAASEWGGRVAGGVLLLSRLAAPIQLADGDGPLLFRPSQEVISWNPRTGRYYQVTSEGGRVLAFVRSAAGHEVLYITAQKVRRIGGRLIGFEGLGVHLLRLADMNLVSLRLPGGNTAFSRLTLGFAQGRAQIGAVTSTGEASTYAIGDKLFVVNPVRVPSGSTVVITPSSVAVKAGLDVRAERSCGFTLKPWNDSRVPSLRVVGQGAARVLPSRFGLGLNGLPLVQSKQ